jgi:hypothetical protein
MTRKEKEVRNGKRGRTEEKRKAKLKILRKQIKEEIMLERRKRKGLLNCLTRNSPCYLKKDSLFHQLHGGPGKIRTY